MNQSTKKHHLIWGLLLVIIILTIMITWNSFRYVVFGYHFALGIGIGQGCLGAVVEKYGEWKFEAGVESGDITDGNQYLWFIRDSEVYMPLWIWALAVIVLWVVSVYRSKQKQARLDLKN